MRVLIGAIVGGLILLVWGFVFWTMLGPVLLPAKSVADYGALGTALDGQFGESGVYWYPDPELMMDDPDAYQPIWDAGPRGYVVYETGPGQGFAPMMIKGVAINVLTVLVACLLLGCGGAPRSYPARVGFLFGLGVLMVSAVHLVGWNFMHHPMDFTLFRIADSLVAWLLVGIVVGAIVKPKAAA